MLRRLCQTLSAPTQALVSVFTQVPYLDGSPPMYCVLILFLISMHGFKFKISPPSDENRLKDRRGNTISAHFQVASTYHPTTI